MLGDDVMDHCKGPRARVASWALALALPACSLETGGLGESGGMSVGEGSGTGSTSGSGPDDTDAGTGATTASGQTESTGSDDVTTSGETIGAEESTGSCTSMSWYLDDDGDGFGAPGTETMACSPPPDHVGNDDDCDDQDANVSPDAVELCNAQDDDCDGITDEGSAQNASCNGCDFLLAADGSRWFAVCDATSDYQGARPGCQTSFGPAAELARIDHPVDQAGLLALIAGTDHWLGLDDLARPDVWRWHDGSLAWMNGAPVGFNGWRFDAPVSGDGDRCGELDAGGWADAECGQQQPRICEHPP
jgi:hypothetical protein